MSAGCVCVCVWGGGGALPYLDGWGGRDAWHGRGASRMDFQARKGTTLSPAPAARSIYSLWIINPLSTVPVLETIMGEVSRPKNVRPTMGVIWTQSAKSLSCAGTSLSCAGTAQVCRAAATRARRGKRCGDGSGLRSRGFESEPCHGFRRWRPIPPLHPLRRVRLSQ